ncbi:putative transporter svop-1 [Spodoptera litura]|uniref:Transporter svop-1 n=1 Tax=Spodoptera litura TaxID=69820 RepID=A0A9J7IUB9_SPOLT|nr:putative transporter svop-1 [Spodoptera litura]
MTFVAPDNLSKKSTYEDALNLTGFGKYNAGMLIACCLLILSMNLDMFGFSVVLPAMACDMSLDTSQQGLLSAIPLIGMIVSSYGWGLCSDTQGRRKTLLIAMPVALILSLATTMAPTFALIAIFKFLSVSFSAAANAAAFVLLAESVPSRHRSRFVFLMASATMVEQLLICSFALPIFTLTFGYEISWLGLVYTPWRMLLQIVCVPCALGTILMIFLQESPKYLLSRGKDGEALEVLKTIYKYNSGENKEDYPVKYVYLNETTADNSAGIPLLKKIWNQTAPLFKPPLLKNSAILFYLLLSAFTTSTGFTMWVPTMTNAYFTGDESHHGRTFCEVASQSATTGSGNGTEIEDCSNSIQTGALYATMVYSGVSTMLMITLSFIVGAVGKKIITLAIFVMSFTAGTLLLFVKVPMLSIALFFMFLYVAQVLGNINTYLVELNPTHLRSMATCLSVVIARGSGFFSVQIIASLLGEYCTPMISGYIVLVMSGFVVATFLPSESKLKSISQGELSRTADVESPKD